MLVTVLAALAAAALFALASALQHRSAGFVGARGRPAHAGLAGFVAATARHPFWVAGTLTELAGLGLHALALRDGPLTMVQPVLVSNLIFALPLRQILEHRRPRPQEVLWAAGLAGGLALLLVAATPGPGPTQAPDPIPTAIAVVGVGVGMLAGGVAGWRSTGERSALLLGAAAGLGFAGTAALIKAVMDELSRHGVVAVFTTWPLYGLGLAGLLSLLLSQLAYEAGPLRASLPAITVVGPVISLVIGVAVFDEPFRHTPVAVIAEAVGLVVVVCAVVLLTSRGPNSALRTHSPDRT